MVLVIEDDRSVREAVTVILELAGYKVLPAANGWEGINIYSEKRAEIKVVLLDLNMPVMNGTEAMHKLLELNPQIKIILATGFHERDVFAGENTARPAGYLQKPFNFDELVAIVNQTWQ